MKRFVVLSIVCLLLFSLVACGDRQQESIGTMAPNATQTQLPTGSVAPMSPTGSVAATATPTSTPDDTTITPDVLSLVFHDDGTVSNGVEDGAQIAGYGETIQIIKDAETGKNVAKFDATDGNYFAADISRYYSQMQDAYTMEIYFNVQDIPATAKKKYFNIFNDDLNNGWALYFYRNDDASSKFLRFDFAGSKMYTQDIELKEWYHCVCVFNDFYVEIYINGELVYTTDFNETPVFTIGSGEQLYIGGKSDGYKVLNGYIGACNLYTEALNAQEINELYTTITDIAEAD